MLTVGSLFSGIGGLDLGLERAGMEVIWQSEIDPFASQVLERHWPAVPNHGDITKIDWSTVERPDVICGGYPCQPFSVAGKRKGQGDARHLWPFFADALRHLRPHYAILENVPGHLSLGFGDVLGDLSDLGYDAEWSTLSSATLGGLHDRTRIFVIAHLRSDPRSRVVQFQGAASQLVAEEGDAAINRSECWDDDICVAQDHATWGPYATAARRWACTVGWNARAFATSRRPSTELDNGGVAYGISVRVDRSRQRTLGNAVVPQCAELVGRLIVEGTD